MTAGRPLVSVVVVAFQQERWIGAALESALAQSLGDLEVVVGDDGSTDGTREIVRELARSDPRVRLLPASDHLGAQRNYLRTLAACHGTFVQQLDGDDLLTGIDKLALQTAFLDAHADCASCFTSGHTLDAEGRRTSESLPPPGRHERYGLTDFAARNLALSPTVLVRASALPDFAREPWLARTSWLAALPAADWPLHVLALQRGDAGYLDVDLAAHRVHPGGIWSGLDAVQGERLDRACQAAFLEHLEPAALRRARPAILSAARRRVRRLAAAGSEFERAAARETRAWLAAVDPSPLGRLRRLDLWARARP